MRLLTFLGTVVLAFAAPGFGRSFLLRMRRAFQPGTCT